MLENHDVTRIVTRFGRAPRPRARAAALLLLALPGPVFLYQGQELGLEEVDLPDELRQDPVFKRTHGERKGATAAVCRSRGRARGPASASARRRPGCRSHRTGASRAWKHNAATPARCSRSSARRSRRPTGPFAWQESPRGTLAFEREDVRCVVNLEGDPLPTEGEVVLASERIAATLPPGAAVWLRR